jgi:hypothetical protein
MAEHSDGRDSMSVREVKRLLEDQAAGELFSGCAIAVAPSMRSTGQIASARVARGKLRKARKLST